MIYRYVPPDSSHFASGLRLNDGRLVWETSQMHDTLLVCMSFGKRPDDRMEELCGELSRAELHPENFTEVLPGISLRYVSALEKSRRNGYPLTRRACTYSVFACLKEDDGLCTVFGHEEQTMIRPYCDVPMEIHLSVAADMRQYKKWFKVISEPTGFYHVCFLDGADQGYHDGDLSFGLDGFKIPVTREMLAERDVYLKCGSAPDFQAETPGLKVIREAALS